ncbi:MAG TPA: transglycosylase SLT domain-containing protein [Rhodocyclaceae bacterium]
MPNALTLRRYRSNIVTLVMRFMHGGLLSAGVVASILIAVLVSNSLQDSAFPARLADAISERNFWPFNTAVAEEAETDAQPLNAPMRAVADSVARRYRVASSAVTNMVRVAQAEARDAGMDPLLVLAVIGIESGFNPVSESVVGAQGLMQVIGKYHPDKLPRDEKAALLDPATNIRVGVLVLRESIQRAGSLQGGLQQYAGALGDPDQTYANKVLAERQRLEQIVRRHPEPI